MGSFAFSGRFPVGSWRQSRVRSLQAGSTQSKGNPCCDSEEDVKTLASHSLAASPAPQHPLALGTRWVPGDALRMQFINLNLLGHP